MVTTMAMLLQQTPALQDTHTNTSTRAHTPKAHEHIKHTKHCITQTHTYVRLHPHPHPQERGIRHFKEVEAEQRGKSSKTIPGDTAFFLYDSMGFPLDLTQVMAEEVRTNTKTRG